MKISKPHLRQLLKEVMGDDRAEWDFFEALKEYVKNARNELSREGYKDADLEKHLKNRLEGHIKEYVKSQEWRRIVSGGY